MGESPTPGGCGGASTSFQLVEGTRCQLHLSGGHTFYLKYGGASHVRVTAPSRIDDGGRTSPTVTEGSGTRGSEGGRG